LPTIRLHYNQLLPLLLLLLMVVLLLQMPAVCRLHAAAAQLSQLL